MAELKPFVLQTIERDQVLAMMREEQKVRLSDEIQQVYTEQFLAGENDPDYVPISIEIEVQKFVLRTFGFLDDDASLREYWKIPSTYWHDEEIKNSCFYMKHNIFQYPTTHVGDPMRDVNVLDYGQNAPVSLSSLHKPGRPLILLAGSMT